MLKDLEIVWTAEKQWAWKQWSVEKADFDEHGFEECLLSTPFLYSPLLSGGNLCSIMPFLPWELPCSQSARDRTKSPQTQSSKTVNQIHLSFVSLSYWSQWCKKKWHCVFDLFSCNYLLLLNDHKVHNQKGVKAWKNFPHKKEIAHFEILSSYFSLRYTLHFSELKQIGFKGKSDQQFDTGVLWRLFRLLCTLNDKGIVPHLRIGTLWYSWSWTPLK